MSRTRDFKLLAKRIFLTCEKIVLRGFTSCVVKVAEEEKKGAPAGAVMPPSAAAAAAAPFLAWPPLLLPWAPALFPGGWCSSAAIRSALPGLVANLK